MGRVVEGLDPRWLERTATRDPVTHAFAVWDLRQEPARTRFVSYVEGEETLAYLLIWAGLPDVPMVHWVGSPSVPGLPERLPKRPLLAVVPPEVVERVRPVRGPIATYPIELRILSPDAPLPTEDRDVRALTVQDAPRLAEFVRGSSDPPLVEGYKELDFARVRAFGAFGEGRLRAVAKVVVALPRVWLLTGIYTDPGARSSGLGRAVTAAAARAARDAGAIPALYVRSDNVPAVRAYNALGFTVLQRKVWIDAGAQRAP